MNWGLFAVIVELICIIILDVIIFKLRKDLKASVKTAHRFESDAKSAEEKFRILNNLIYGDRVPGRHCEGCKNLIRSPLPSWVQATQGTQYTYGCRKNLRCKEYEEEEDVH